MFSIKFQIEGVEFFFFLWLTVDEIQGPFHHKSIIGKVPKSEAQVRVSSSVWCQYVYFAKPEQAGNIETVHITIPIFELSSMRIKEKSCPPRWRQQSNLGSYVFDTDMSIYLSWQSQTNTFFQHTGCCCCPGLEWVDCESHPRFSMTQQRQTFQPSFCYRILQLKRIKVNSRVIHKEKWKLSTAPFCTFSQFNWRLVFFQNLGVSPRAEHARHLCNRLCVDARQKRAGGAPQCPRPSSALEANGTNAGFH